MRKLGISLILIFLGLVAFHFIISPTKDEFKENDVYDEIISRGKIRVGINTDSKPFGFINEKGLVDGYDADLAKYIAQYIVRSRDRIEFVPVTPSNRLIKVSTGKVDIVISTVTITPQREEIVDFSIPYDSAGLAILVKSNSAIKSLTDLSGQTVGVVFGTTAEKNMKNLVPTANLRGFRTYNAAYKALKNNHIDAITSDDTILSRYTVDDKSVKLLPKRYSNEPYGIAFKKGYSTAKLKENIDFAVRDLQQKNVITRLRKKWEIRTL
ncbi:MAG: transporter substrate-binding domain-containing protein [Cyanobacteria bacterium SIG28]|nr:transporter substrate-binding domain-containing protein [Cyanobacteria bacterium SIG28]